MSQVWLVALIRAVTGAVVIAGAAFFATLSTGTTISQAGVAAGAAGFAYLATRGAAEGLYDSLGSKVTPEPVTLLPGPVATPPPPPAPPPAPPPSGGLMGGGNLG